MNTAANISLYHCCTWSPGTLPAAWSRLAALKSLSLGLNHLSGTIPSSWGKAFTNMQFLDLSGT